MFYNGYESSFEAWHLAYAAYLLWIAGLSGFFLMVSTSDPTKIVVQLRGSYLGLGIVTGIYFALAAAGFAWPLLFLGPLLIVKMGAPTGAGIVAAAYFITSFYFDGRLLMARWPYAFSRQ